jgi:hypothetical protein
MRLLFPARKPESSDIFEKFASSHDRPKVLTFFEKSALVKTRSRVFRRTQDHLTVSNVCVPLLQRSGRADSSRKCPTKVVLTADCFDTSFFYTGGAYQRGFLKFPVAVVLIRTLCAGLGCRTREPLAVRDTSHNHARPGALAMGLAMVIPGRRRINGARRSARAREFYGADDRMDCDTGTRHRPRFAHTPSLDATTTTPDAAAAQDRTRLVRTSVWPPVFL